MMNSFPIYCLVATILFVSVTNSFSFTGSKVFAMSHKKQQQQSNHIKNTNILHMTSTETERASLSEWFQKLFASFSKNGSAKVKAVSEPPVYVPPPKQPQSAVLILGGTGRAGQEIVKTMSQSSKDVVLASRKNTEEGRAVLAQLPNFETLDSDHLFPRFNVDVTDAATLTPEVFKGVESVVSCIGPSFSDPRLNAEAVDYNGNLNLIAAAQKYLGNKYTPVFKSVYNFEKPSRNISQWSRLDDVLMGGRSQSQWSEVDWAGEGAKFLRWSGKVITDGGGFCGTVCKENLFEIDPSYFDGIMLRVRGDGNRYKLRLRTSDGSFDKGFIYQAPFDTVNGQWTDIKLPFDYFYNNRQTVVNYAPEDSIKSRGKFSFDAGFVYSKFDFNERLNSKFLSESFQLDVESIQLYRDVRPAFVLISSAGTERVNRLTAAERMKDIPIVQLNPQGILNWKFKAEEALRASGIPFSIIRSSGIVPYTAANNTRLVEFGQCDMFSGRITRNELATLVNEVLNNPRAVGKTFEVRRDESDSGLLGGPSGNWGSVQTNFNKLFDQLVPDSDRTVRGLPPLPFAQDPPLPPTKEQTEAILNDPRVVAVREREAKEKAAATADESSE